MSAPPTLVGGVGEAMMMRCFALALAAVLIPLSACAATSASSAPANGPLWRADGGGVAPSAGSVAMTGFCWRVSLSLKRDPAAPDVDPPRIRGEPAPCREPSIYVGYLRDTLFLEGVDAKGGRLFVASGANPLHQDSEAPPAPEGGAARFQSADSSAATVSTLISVPVAAPLRRLRWYDVDANQQPHLLGETAWNGAQSATH